MSGKSNAGSESDSSTDSGRSAELTEEALLDIWAFGTSPHGLALSERRLWSLSPREYFALRAQWQGARDHLSEMHASIQATLYNAHFLESGGEPYLPEDLMGKGDRQKRKMKRQKEKMETARVNAKLAKMKPGQTPEGLPEWAVN